MNVWNSIRYSLLQIFKNVMSAAPSRHDFSKFKNKLRSKKDKKLLHTYPVFPEDWWCKLVNCYVSTAMWTTKEKLRRVSLLKCLMMRISNYFQALNNIHHFCYSKRCCFHFDLPADLLITGFTRVSYHPWDLLKALRWDYCWDWELETSG